MTGFVGGAYDPILVLSSLGLAAGAAFVAFGTGPHIAASSGRARFGWVVSAATAMGGGIWSAHAVGMLALLPSVTVTYSLPAMLISLAIAIDVSGVGLALAAGGRNPARLALGGLVLGLAIAAAHFANMAAMHRPAIAGYDVTIAGFSVAIGWFGATVALGLASSEGGLRRRLVAAGFMGAAICGMHYAAAEAAFFAAMPSSSHPRWAEIDRGTLQLLVAGVGAIVLGLELLSRRIRDRAQMPAAHEAPGVDAAAERYRHLVQSSNDIFLVVTRTGQIALAVQSQGLTGLDARTLEGRSVFDLVEGQGVDLLRRALIVHGPRSVPAHVDRLKIRKEGGSPRDYDATLCNMSHESSIGGVIITFHDVTERERAVAEPLAAKKISEDASRLKSEFIANMNHELRTPLNAILGFSELMVSDVSGRLADGRYRDYAKDIHRSGAQLLSIIDDILDFAKADAKQLSLHESVVDTSALVEDSVRFVMPVANKKGVRIVTRIESAVPRLRGDERRLRQILLNLLSNAVKFTPVQGEVRVLVHPSDAGGIQIDVEDTGIGIPPDQIGRVMEPFYQVDGSLARTQEGTGLGLPIARSLAELHGGTLQLESAAGCGTAARLVLPPERVVRETAAA